MYPDIIFSVLSSMHGNVALYRVMKWAVRIIWKRKVFAKCWCFLYVNWLYRYLIIKQTQKPVRSWTLCYPMLNCAKISPDSLQSTRHLLWSPSTVLLYTLRQSPPHFPIREWNTGIIASSQKFTCLLHTHDKLDFVMNARVYSTCVHVGWS